MNGNIILTLLVNLGTYLFPMCLYLYFVLCYKIQTNLLSITIWVTEFVHLLFWFVEAFEGCLNLSLACQLLIMKHVEAALDLNMIAKLVWWDKTRLFVTWTLNSNLECIYILITHCIEHIMHADSKSRGNRVDQSGSSFVWSHNELYLHRACKITNLVVKCLSPNLSLGT